MRKGCVWSTSTWCRDPERESAAGAASLEYGGLAPALAEGDEDGMGGFQAMQVPAERLAASVWPASPAKPRRCRPAVNQAVEAVPLAGSSNPWG